MKALDSKMLSFKLDGDHNSIDGRYAFKHPAITGYYFNVIVSDGMGWDHVSVTLFEIVGQKSKGVPRTPTWGEMCLIKDFFFNKDECVVQFHPPESEYVNTHKYCLHLWRPQGVTLPLPETIMV